MTRIYLDFETYWSDDYTLKRMTPVEYIQDVRFEALGCSFGIGDEKPFWVDGSDLPRFFSSVQWGGAYSVSHNALFDMLILSLRYGVVPAGYGCTLSMARNWLSHKLPSVSLDAVAQHYGMPPKWGTANKFKGLNLAAIKAMPALYNEMRGYAIDDTVKCRSIFASMIAEGFPPGELEVVDMVVRMATIPQFELDPMVLAEHLHKVQAAKQALLDACYVNADDVSALMSDQQLAMKLLFLGVDIPMKMSKRTGKLAYAFAKSDKDFTDLLEHDNPLVQALVAARLGHKSTLEETRTQRLLSIANVVEKMPVPLKYSGAHTHRFSGDWKINLQNLPRGSELRRAFRAPKGKVVVSVDASQIEARFNASLAGEAGLCDAFRAGRDVYAEFAKNIYGYEVNKRHHPKERFVGKTAILSLGYGSSWAVFQNMCRMQGGVELSDSEAARIVKLYRTLFPGIVANWRDAHNNILLRLWQGASNADLLARSITGQPVLEWGPLDVVFERGEGGEGKHALRLPNGNYLRYGRLRREYDEIGREQYFFNRGRGDQKIYGAKLVENVCQALAFIHIMETAKRVKRVTQGRFMPAHQVHDELIYIAGEGEADWLAQLVGQEMSQPPEWMPEWMPAIPLAAESHVADNYGATK